MESSAIPTAGSVAQIQTPSLTPTKNIINTKKITPVKKSVKKAINKDPMSKI